ncbi:MAG TPA: hypothetical protein VEH05_10410 [Streptosporangiaceae bacterium]|nr:hypothetical protein [Streptosporangiaceae bacterium]
MKLTPIAAASLLPATLAGIAFSVMPFVNGSSVTALTAHTTGRPAAHTVSHVRPSAHREARHTTATATAATKPAAVPTQPAGPQPTTGNQGASGLGSVTATSGQPLTAGMSAFEQCVAWRESGDTPTDPDGLFGILPSVWAQLGYSGTAGQASVAQQMVAFSRLYAEYGTQPWAPSDGC